MEDLFDVLNLSTSHTEIIGKIDFTEKYIIISPLQLIIAVCGLMSHSEVKYVLFKLTKLFFAFTCLDTASLNAENLIPPCILIFLYIKLVSVKYGINKGTNHHKN